MAIERTDTMRFTNACVALLVAALVLTIATQAVGQAEKAAETEKVDLPAPQPAADAKAKWHTSLDEALKVAKAEKKPVFIDFYADWCAPCRMFAAQTLPDPRVQKVIKSFVLAKINVDQNQPTAQSYSVRGIPALIVVDADGKALARTTGFKPPEALIDFLGYASAIQKMAADPKDAEAAFVAADKSAAVELPDGMRRNLIKVALKLSEKAGPERRSRLIFLRGQAQLSAQNGDAAAAKKDLAAARKLDPQNAYGVREGVDWLMAIITLNETENAAGFIASARKFLADYPIDKVKDKTLHFNALGVIFEARETSGDLAGAIRILEQVKTDHGDRVNVAALDAKIANLKAVMKATANPSGAGKAPGQTPAKDDGQK
jgi:thiol-disulfide isomerase/thioredoxin